MWFYEYYVQILWFLSNVIPTRGQKTYRWENICPKRVEDIDF